MTILVSGCLLGLNCRYCGDGCYHEEIAALKEEHHLVPVCPEILGGLSTPRPPAEIVGDQVINSEGIDVTAAFKKGAEEVLKMAHLFDAKYAILKKNSPSCGYGQRYDGTFSGKLTEGHGVTGKLLSEQGIIVCNEKNFKDYIADLSK